MGNKIPPRVRRKLNDRGIRQRCKFCRRYFLRYVDGQASEASLRCQGCGHITEYDIRTEYAWVVHERSKQ